jgi:subtilisin family serine protease
VERHDRLIPVALAALAFLAGAAPAHASHRAPLVLPDGASASSAWIIAGRDGRAADALARRRHAREIAPGVFLVAGRRATGLAAALARRGLLRWAEPDRPVSTSPVARTAAAPAPWRDRLGVDGLTPPPVASGTPWLAFLDTAVDLTHPALPGPWISSVPPLLPVADLHGTATAAVAAAVGSWPGVWPGMHVRSFAMSPETMSCSTSAELVGRSVRAGASIINMSYGGRDSCFAEYAALQDAVRHGVVVIAAAGNDFTLANELSYPAAFPHVVTAAALGPRDAAAYFSSASDATDLAAPGQGIVTAVPPLFDDDDVPDGLKALTGTSFSSPMVAAAATWLRARRPSLTADQVSALLCRGARDVGRAGWDRRTGCGALDLAGALSATAPRPDPAEPNDDVVWVDGIGFGRPAAALWRGGRRRTIHAAVTTHDDPVDVYRIVRPAGSTLHVTLTTRGATLRLRVLDRAALDVGDREALLGQAGATPVMRVAAGAAPTGGRAAYVAVMRRGRPSERRSAYTLTIGR